MLLYHTLPVYLYSRSVYTDTVDCIHNNLLTKEVRAHCNASEETTSGKSSAITSFTAQGVSSCGIVPSASVSAHNRLSFSYVGKKYLQKSRQNDQPDSLLVKILLA